MTQASWLISLPSLRMFLDGQVNISTDMDLWDWNIAGRVICDSDPSRIMGALGETIVVKALSRSGALLVGRALLTSVEAPTEGQEWTVTLAGHGALYRQPTDARERAPS